MSLEHKPHCPVTRAANTKGVDFLKLEFGAANQLLTQACSIKLWPKRKNVFKKKKKISKSKIKNWKRIGFYVELH